VLARILVVNVCHHLAFALEEGFICLVFAFDQWEDVLDSVSCVGWEPPVRSPQNR
jgi:hypothetical protein